MENRNEDRVRLDSVRSSAAKYFADHYEREQRYLIVFARDFSEYLNSAKWLQSPDARLQQKYFDFLLDFESLKAKMQEFCWSKDFLKENGIDFAAIRKLYFSVR